MWKLVPSLFSLMGRRNSSINVPLRTFLSDTFKLEKEWNERLASPILKKINVNDMFYELDNQFQHFANASALDIDLFVNAVDDSSNFDEVEDVVHKLRLSPEAINILPSTQHALIRLYLKYNKEQDLIRVLDDRLNYGIFSDEYCNLLMMDKFIKEGNFRDAAKVSTFCMLQEDFSNPLIKYMSLYACHKYLDNPVPWSNQENLPEETEDDEEEVKVRVKFLRNPYFDDHFDLVDPKHLIGKTLHFIGSEIDDHVGKTYRIIGLLLHDKLKKATEYLELLVKNENQVFIKDGFKIAQSILDEKLNQENKESEVTLLKELKNIFDKVSDSHLVTEGNLLSFVEDKLKDLVSKNESLEIDKQIKIYKEWEKTREKLLLEQIAKITMGNRLAEIQREKQLLKDKEEELFFFENEDKLDLIIEEKEKRKEEERARENAILKARNPMKKEVEKKKSREPEEPPVDSFFDENIPMKLIKTKL